jgi:hypothetical protein
MSRLTGALARLARQCLTEDYLACAPRRHRSGPQHDRIGITLRLGASMIRTLPARFSCPEIRHQPGTLK